MVKDKVNVLCYVDSLFGTFSCARFPEALGKGIVVNFELSDLKFKAN